MLFLASDLLSREEVWPALDPGVLAGSEGEGTAAGMVVARPVDVAWCVGGGCSPGISPPPDVSHPARAPTTIVSPRTMRALAPMTSRRHDPEWWSGKAGLCSECAGPDGGSGTGESIRRSG